MRKLALSDEILMTIEKPARYIGGEVNAVMKDKEKVDIRFAMCFPDVYEIGMTLRARSVKRSNMLVPLRRASFFKRKAPPAAALWSLYPYGVYVNRWDLSCP